MKASILFLVVLLSACGPWSVKSPREVDYLVSVEGYLVENIGIASFGGQVFCSFDTLDNRSQNENLDISVWALCEEFYLDGNSLEMGTGSSLPVALHLQRIDGDYRLLSYAVSKDGLGYGPSIQSIFSQVAIQRMCEGNPDCYNGRAQRLELENLQKAREYYGIAE